MFCGIHFVIHIDNTYRYLLMSVTFNSDGELLFNAVPMLKIDGMKLVQTNAILNYLATKYGINGKDAEEKAM